MNYWRCVWCLKDFAHEEDCENHEKRCSENPNNQKNVEWSYTGPPVSVRLEQGR